MRVTKNGIRDLSGNWKAQEIHDERKKSAEALRLKEEGPEPKGPVHDLIYDGSDWPEIKAAFPAAVHTDASDFIHESRFEVTIEGVSWDDWFRFLLKTGIAGVSFHTQLTLRMYPKRILRLMDEVNPGWREKKTNATLA